MGFDEEGENDPSDELLRRSGDGRGPVPAPPGLSADNVID